MNQMNVGGMNQGPGGPVGGMPMMNNGSNAPRGDANANIQEIMIVKLNTYIYDYFIKRGYYDCARALVQDDQVPIKTSPRPKQSPGNRRDGVNGIDGDAMLTDSKDDAKSRIPDDLPRPDVAESGQQNSFLFDWFNLFWDMFSAQRNRDKVSDATRYLQHTQNVMRLQNQQLLQRPQMMPAAQFNQYNAMRNARNGMIPNNLQKSVLQNKNMSPQQLAQLHNKNQQAQMLQHQAQREHMEMDMNGHRPQSPASTENAPSPSKRPRLEGSQVNGQQMAPNGRGQGQAIPGQGNQQANVLLMQHGINPKSLTPAQYQSFQAQNPAVQAKSIQVYAQNLALHHSRSAMNNQGMPNGLMNPGVMPNQGDIMPPMPDGQGLLMGEYYNNNGQMPPVRPGMQTPGGQNGNHALQDYQMQLMMLEQQNKRRLIMARQEQDTMARADGQPGIPGQPGLPPGTSPQDSRSGASPNPGEQMKRGTPKMPQTGLPGSPSAADGMAPGRGSPASMGFNGQMPPDMANPQFFHMKNMPEGMVAPNGMRPPSSNPAFSGPQGAQSMDAMARQQQPPGAGNRMPSGNWQPGPQGQPMVPQQQQQPSGGQPQSVGTPQERNTMPPPQAPPAGGPTTGRTQPSSPQAAPAPPTPQQSNKPAPKGKKEPKDTNRKRPQKKGANTNANAAPAPSTEAEQPATTTPSTPITAGHQNTFNKGAANATSNPPQPTSAPAPQPLGQQQPQDPNPQSFGDIMGDAGGLNVDFASLDSNEMGLDTFDFDNFLNADGTNDFVFDGSLGFPPDGLEAGATDPMG